MLLTIAFFAIARTDTFLTTENLKVILIQAAPLAVIAFGLTVVLVMGDFDLSFGAVAGLAGGVAISLMVKSGVPWLPAVLLTLLAGVATGSINGLLAAYIRAPAFIATLAVGTAATGVEYLITDQRAIYSDIPQAFVDIGQGSVLGINGQILIAVVVLAGVITLLRYSESGRRMYAVGGSHTAAELAGLRVARLRLAGFMVTGLLAALAGMMVTADNGAYTPNIGAGYLLPAYAAAFLGTTAVGRGLFTPLGTAIGVVFLAAIQNGLILLGLSAAWVNIVQGAILAGALVAARMGKR